MVTRDTHYHPNHPHLDTRDAPLISGLPQGRANDTPIRIHVTRLSYPDYLKEVQTILISIKHPDDFHKYIRMTNISHLDIIVRITDWSKQVLYVITTACHGPRSAICRVKGQDEVTISHFPRSLHAITYHDLGQPPVGWWWPWHYLVSW